MFILKDKYCYKYIFSYIWNNISSLLEIKMINEDFYWTLFNSAYELLDSKQKLYLWLNDLNNKYDYAEFLQNSHLLSIEERKLFNRKIKEYAKNDRFNRFLEQVPNAEIIKYNNSDIVYKCKWRNLYYKKSQIIVFLNKEEALPSFFWEPSRDEWNWLTNEYFNRKRIGDIIVHTCNRNVVKIEGLETIEEHIIIATIQHKGSITNRLDINNEQIIKIIHNVSARNKCIDFLSKQNSPFNVIDIQELVSSRYGDIKRDISFMFIIPHEADAYIIWESVEYDKSKATYIFKHDRDSAYIHAQNIKTYIETNLYARSQLIASDNEVLRNNLKFYARINHDSEKYIVWEERMKDLLPFLL